MPFIFEVTVEWEFTDDRSGMQSNVELASPRISRIFTVCKALCLSCASGAKSSVLMLLKAPDNVGSEVLKLLSNLGPCRNLKNSDSESKEKSAGLKVSLEPVQVYSLMS